MQFVTLNKTKKNITMKKSAFLSLFLLPILLLNSCDLLNKQDTGLSSTDIVEGLKTALTLGTDSSSKALSSLNGYYGDKLLKIALPPEANVILEHKNDQIFKTLGLTSQIDAQIEKVILSINRSAEDAAKDAAPIFKNAITNLSITDGLSILNGKNPSTMKAGTETATFDSLAATNYLQSQTLSDLTKVFSTPINNSLNKDLLGLGFSTNKAWSTLSGLYNQGVDAYNAANVIGLYTNMEKVTAPDLGTYCTNKALTGLFLKVGDEEKKIRKNPFDWAIDIIRKVFGSVSK